MIDENSERYVWVSLADALFTSLLEKGALEHPKIAMAFACSFAAELEEKGWQVIEPEGE